MHDIRKTTVGYDITLTRGDTLVLQLNLMKNKAPFTPSEGSVIRFAMKVKYDDNTVELEKQISLDTLVLHIEPNDTKNLVMGKTYVYDIELTDESGNVDTFIKGKFNIDYEVK